MDRTRIGFLGLILGAVITLAASAFAVGAAITSDDDSDTAGGGDVTVPAATEASGSTPGSVVESAAGTSPPATATARFDIEIAGFRFNPQDAVVAVGTEVVWTNNDSDVHSVISDDGLFPSSDTFGNGESYAVVFDEPGTYQYHCGVHSFMTGNSITVEA